jgi:anaerobic selenocysteine-containing dehydrogenase
MNGAHYARAADGPPPIHVSADAAARHGLRSGDRIRVSTPSGAVEGLARVDETLAAGSIWISHGWPEQNVNRLTDRAADRLTGQPVFTGVPVRIERIEAAGAELARANGREAGNPSPPRRREDECVIDDRAS